MTDGSFDSRSPAQAERLLAMDSGLNEAQRRNVRWHPVRFPHREFMELMPERRVFGWYGCEFDVPVELVGMDVLVDLGIIDDSDETFVNGTQIGGMGRVPEGSAWQSDRLYRISSELLKRERNYLAVHVWSLWGLGGIVGPPVLKAALAPSVAEWHLAFVKDTVTLASDLNQATTAKDALASFANGGALDWRKASRPWKGFAAWRDDEHYAVFKFTFELKNADGSPKGFSRPMTMDAGPVFDVAAFYLNGRRVGLVGRFPHGEVSAFTEAAQRARFAVPPDAWSSDGRNELVAVVYRERGVGGLPGVPGLLLSSPMNHQPQAFGDVSDAFLIQLQSGNIAEAEKTLAGAIPQTDAERVWLLSHRAHLAFLKWHDGGRTDAMVFDGVLAPVAEILANYSAESPKQSAMQSFCRILRLAERDSDVMDAVRKRFPAFGKTCRMLPPDRATRGDWPLFYGGAQTILPAYGKLSELVHPLGGKELYTVVTGDPNDMARRWQPRSAASVAPPNAHVMPASQRPLEWEDAKWPLEYWRTGRLFPDVKMRRAAWWDDHGEMHPFDDAGPDLTTTLGRAIGGGQMLSLHLSDFDWRTTPHPRQQSIILTDVSGHLLNACWSGKSDMGVYERFVFSEETKVRFKVMKHRGACVAVSGVFIDAPGAIADDSSDALPAASNMAKALALVEAAERTHSQPSALAEYRSLLSGMEDLDSVLWLARRMARSHGIRHVWLALAAGRLMELRGEKPDNVRRQALKAVAELCDFTSRIPFTGIFLHMAEE